MSLFTQTSGNGPDLVLIHGWGLHSGIWDKFVPLLEPDFRVTRVDLPGHGRSEWQGQTTLDDMVDAVLSVVPVPAAWLGWSLGGLVAMRAAGKAVGQVTALVTVASTPCFVRKPGWQSALLPELLDTFATELGQDYQLTMKRFLSLQVPGSQQAGAVLKTLRDSLLVHGEPAAAALRAGLNILQSADLRADVAAIGCPTLLLMGERDTLVPVNAGHEAAQLFPDARVAVVAGAGHAPFIASPQVVAEQVYDFLLIK